MFQYDLLDCLIIWEAFFRHLALVVILTLMSLPLAGAGHALGLSKLFWHEHRGVQFVVGMAVGLVFSTATLVALTFDFNVWAEEVAIRESAIKFAGSQELLSRVVALPHLAVHLHFMIPIAVPFALFIAFVTFCRSQFSSKSPDSSSSWIERTVQWIKDGAFLTLGFPVGVGFACLFEGLFGSIIFTLDLSEDPLPPWPQIYFLYIAAVAFLGALVIEWFRATKLSISSLRFHSPAVSMCLVFVFYCWVYGGIFALVEGVKVREIHEIPNPVIQNAEAGGQQNQAPFRFVETQKRTPVGAMNLLFLLSVLGFLTLVGLPRFKSRIRSVDDAGYYKTFSETSTSLPTEMIPDRVRIPVDDGPIVLVAVSGGGITAAAWVVAMLQRLENELPELLSRTELIAGASGGMLGAAATVTTSVEGEKQRIDPEVRYSRVASDFLTPVIHQWCFHDGVRMAVPLRTRFDRGTVLEMMWEELFSDPECNEHRGMKQTFKELAQREGTCRLPTLVFSPMIVESGRRLIISSRNFSSLESEHRNGMVQFFKLYPRVWERMTVASAVRLSASFPYVTPAAQLPSPNGGFRVVDAGYFDNYGVNFLVSWLFEHKAELKNRRIAVIEIRNSDVESTLSSPVNGRRRPILRRGVDWLTTPIEGLLSSWQSVMGYRNSQELEWVKQYLGEYVETFKFDYSYDAPLSWYLASKEREEIAEAAKSDDRVNDEVERLKRWWTKV